MCKKSIAINLIIVYSKSNNIEYSHWALKGKKKIRSLNINAWASIQIQLLKYD